MDGQWQAVALLIAALALFLVSTRQFGTRVRLAVLAGAFALLGAAAVVGLRDELGTDAVRVLQSALGNNDVMRAVGSNWPTVVEAIQPLFLVFVIVAGLLGVASLVALAPGEMTERLIRPPILLLAGVALGGLMALTAVALGFGGYHKPRAYVFSGMHVEVVDGDTLQIGDVPLRLAGIDALESGQTCMPSGSACGEAAAGALREIVSNGVVVCNRADQNNEIPPEESFGRPIVECQVLNRSGAVSLGDRMRALGWPVDYAPIGTQVPSLISVEGECTLHPRNWRRNADWRDAFQREGRCGESAAVSPINP